MIMIYRYLSTETDRELPGLVIGNRDSTHPDYTREVLVDIDDGMFAAFIKQERPEPNRCEVMT